MCAVVPLVVIVDGKYTYLHVFGIQAIAESGRSKER